MPIERVKRPGAIAAAAASLIALAGCAGGDTVSTGSGYGTNLVFDTLAGVALIPEEREEIDYTPRTELVMPANAGALPAPQEKRVVTNPNWPQDPDAPGEGLLAGLTPEEQRRTLYQRIAGAGEEERTTRPSNAINDRNREIRARDDSYRNAREIRRISAERRGSDVNEDGTPRRRFLTDPPVTYRAPAAATTAEGQVIAQQAATAEPRKRGLRRLIPF